MKNHYRTTGGPIGWIQRIARITRFALLVATLGIVLGPAVAQEKKPEPPPENKPTAAEPEAANRELELSAARFVDDLVAGRWDAAGAHFDATMKKHAPPAMLEKIWASVLDRLGPFQKRMGFRHEKQEQYRFVFVACQFEKGPIDLKVVFNAKNEIAGFFYTPFQSNAPYRAPDYVNRSSFRETEVTFGDPDWRIPGTLTLPRGRGPFLAVVLVHGSGPNDRDETIGPSKPFRDLAWGLASRGIAVLRYDKRTKVHGARIARMPELTVREETVDDAAYAVALLRGRKDIDPKGVFVLGHSLGAMLVPRIGLRTPEAAGFIVMAGPARPLEDLILYQYRYLYSLDGSISETDQKQLDDLARKVDRVKKPDLDLKTPIQDLPLGVPAAYWLDLQGYHPPTEARKLQRPLLVLQGERDYQVPMPEFEAWKIALKDQPGVTFLSFPPLNHLFIAGKGKSTPAEYQKVGHVDADVIRTIAAWIIQLDLTKGKK